MAKHTIPHLVYLFQDLGEKFQELRTFLLHAVTIQEEMIDIWEEILDKAEEPFEDDQD